MFKLLAFIQDCTDQFVLDLVGNPEDRFSHDTAHISAINPFVINELAHCYHGDRTGLLSFLGAPDPEVIKRFSSSAQLSMKFQLLINA